MSKAVKQQTYQNDHRKRGLCILCPLPGRTKPNGEIGVHCVKHHKLSGVKHRAWLLKKNGAAMIARYEKKIQKLKAGAGMEH